MRIRLNKYLQSQGLCSRREADRWIMDGKVSVNNIIAVVGQIIEEDIDTVKLDNAKITELKAKTYWMLNKPAGYVCSMTKTQHSSMLVSDLMPKKASYFLCWKIG